MDLNMANLEVQFSSDQGRLNSSGEWLGLGFHPGGIGGVSDRGRWNRGSKFRDWLVSLQKRWAGTAAGRGWRP